VPLWKTRIQYRRERELVRRNGRRDGPSLTRRVPSIIEGHIIFAISTASAASLATALAPDGTRSGTLAAGTVGTVSGTAATRPSRSMLGRAALLLAVSTGGQVSITSHQLQLQLHRQRRHGHGFTQSAAKGTCFIASLRPRAHSRGMGGLGNGGLGAFAAPCH
jgi:hypothetical protein